MQNIGPHVRQYLEAHHVAPEQAMEGAGCETCRNTGYQGRLGIYELFEMDDDLRDLVTGNPTLTELRRHCRERGMRNLRGDGFLKVAAGITTIDEVLRATEGG